MPSVAWIVCWSGFFEAAWERQDLDVRDLLTSLSTNMRTLTACPSMRPIFFPGRR